MKIEMKISIRKPWRVLHVVVAGAGVCALLGCKPATAPEEDVATDVAVQVGKVTRATLRAFVDAYGIVEPEPAGNGKPAGAAALAAPSAGIVMAVPVSEGDNVQAGTVVVKLDDRIALAAVDKASNAVAYAEEQLARQNKLAEMANTSEKALEDVRRQLAAARADLASAQAQLALVQLTSPLDGIVSRVNVHPGEAVDLNTIVAEIVDLERLVVTVGIPASEVSALKVGQPSEIFTGNGDKPAATGSVSFISPTVDENTGTALVRVAVPKDTGLRPGQFVRVRIVSEERAGRLAVPIESVVTDDEGHNVIAVVEGDKASQKPVKTGIREGDLVEVEGAGLKEGDTVVTVGAYGLPKETKVRVLNP